MKKILTYFVVTLLLLTNEGYSQLKINKNSVVIPNVTTTQKNQITSPETGSLVYDSNQRNLAINNGSNWQNITSNNSYKNSLTYHAILIDGTQNIQTFTVPSNVYEIMVEIWGIGGDGGVDYGGCAGSYARVVLPVQPNNIFSIFCSDVIGCFSFPPDPATYCNHTYSFIAKGADSLSVRNGRTNYSSNNYPAIVKNTFPNVYSLVGNCGTPTTSTFLTYQNGTTPINTRFRKFGNGANSYGFANGGYGGDGNLANTSNNSDIFSNGVKGTDGGEGGGGGGGGTYPDQKFGRGGKGLVVISF
jgi:hypothetical protein